MAVELSKRLDPSGDRFLVKEYSKVEEHRLRPDDLLFAIRDPANATGPKLRVVPDRETLGLTDPNDHGRQYRHGTLSAYTAAKCRCQHSRAAFAIYRSQRRAGGKNPREPSET
ncbi:hypothetical protein Ait01nite_025510 [Actinoplanes italicus]|nr:hypothetical protein Ait01nite_025510 [Actinoplanes italicus]